MAGIGLVELFVDGERMRKILERFAVIGGFGLVVLWRWMNRIALDLDRRHL